MAKINFFFFRILCIEKKNIKKQLQNQTQMWYFCLKKYVIIKNPKYFGCILTINFQIVSKKLVLILFKSLKIFFYYKEESCREFKKIKKGSKR